MTPLSPFHSRSAFRRLVPYGNGAGYNNRSGKELALKICPIPEEQPIEILAL